MSQKMMLSGDDITPALGLKESEVNHMRLMLAWMRCQYMIDDDMQRGLLNAASDCVRLGIATPEQAGDLVTKQAERMAHCPKYVRQAVRMLTIALRKHEASSRIVESEKP